MMTVMNTPSAHDVPMANTRLVAPKDAVCVQQALLMTTPIQPHPVPLVRQALRQEKRMWDLVYLVKLDSTQAIWQPSAPTAQLAHQMATLTRPHLAQTAKLALLQQRSGDAAEGGQPAGQPSQPSQHAPRSRPVPRG